jgi:hypothetical protein
MRTSSNRHLFIGHKSQAAIPFVSTQRRDYLIQATLDYGVRAIEYHPAMRIDGAVVRIDALIIDADSGRFAVDLSDARAACDPDAEGLMHLAFEEECSGIMVVADAEIRREPRFSACRTVWQHCNVHIRGDDREAVMHVLHSEGPVPLRALQGLVDTTRDVETIVYSLACSGDVCLDLRTAPLDERTVVRAGHRPSVTFGQRAYGV